MKKALLALADGTVFEGTSFGAEGEQRARWSSHQHDGIPEI